MKTKIFSSTKRSRTFIIIYGLLFILQMSFFSWLPITIQAIPVKAVSPYCGDGQVNQASEQCDDGNTNNYDSCQNDCSWRMKKIPLHTCKGNADLFLYQGADPFQYLGTAFTVGHNQLLIFNKEGPPTLSVQVNGSPATLTLAKEMSGVRIYSVVTQPGDLVSVNGSCYSGATNLGARCIQGYLSQDSANPAFNLNTLEVIWDNLKVNQLYLTPDTYSFAYFDKYTSNGPGQGIDLRKLKVMVDGPGGNIFNQTYTQPFPAPNQGAVVGTYTVPTTGIYNVTLDTEDSIFWLYDSCTAPVCGDGQVDEIEQCDDGNQNNYDICQNDCTIRMKKIPLHTCNGDGDLYLYQGSNPFQSLNTAFVVNYNQVLLFNKEETLSLTAKVNGNPVPLVLVKQSNTPFLVKIYSIATIPGSTLSIAGTCQSGSNVLGARCIQGYLAQNSANPVYDLSTLELVYDSQKINQMYLTPGTYAYTFFDKYSINSPGQGTDNRNLNVTVNGPSGLVLSQSYIQPSPPPSQGVIFGSFTANLPGNYSMSITTQDSIYWLYNNCPQLPVCGNGQVEAGEECDDGNTNNSDDCNNECKNNYCVGADVVKDLAPALWVVGNGCYTPAKSSDSTTIDIPVAGRHVVKGVARRGNPGQCQTNESYYLNINSENGPIAADDAGPCVESVRLDELGSFNFTSGTNTLTMNTGSQCPPDTHANSVEVNKICIYYDQFCGDGQVEAGEACDDGNQNNTDGCLNACILPVCSDGYIWAGHEACDDNGNNGVACTPPYGGQCSYCSSVCQPVNLTGPTCGDGVVNGPEECDDGNTNNNDQCKNNCTLPGCGSAVDVMMVLDRSGSMGYTSICDWWQLKCVNPPSCSSGYNWVKNTTYNQTQSWCTAKNQSAPHNSVWTEYNPVKITAAKLAANGFIDLLGVNDQSGLVSYANNATLDKQLSNNHAATQAAVNSLITNGATDIGDAIKLGTEELLSPRANIEANKVMILLTDGLANKPYGPGYGEWPADVAYAQAKVSEAAAAGIKIYTIGLGNDGDINEIMLQNIATNSGGQYYRAPTASQLQEIFDQIAVDTCSEPVCGNGIKETGEACDGVEGVGPHQSCTANCTLINLTYCGDGTKQSPNSTGTGGPSNNGYEACDGQSGVGPHQTCSQTCTLINLTYCGDYIKQSPNQTGTGGPNNNGYEACDGQSGVGPHQTCSQNCTLVNLTYCGDGIKQSPNQTGTGGPNNNGYEACDGQSGVGPDQTCSQNCVLTDLPYCGDGIKNGAEECDDGNQIDTDDCKNDCTQPSICEFSLDVAMVMDRSGSMGDTSRCDWWQLKCVNPPSCSSGYNWVKNTTYNQTQAWCNAKNQSAPHNSVWTEYNPSKLNAAKQTANSFLDLMGVGDQSALVSFANNATLDKTLSNNHDQTKTAINSLVASGATDIGDAINLAKGELTSIRINPSADQIMILLTDGKANKPNGPGYGEWPADVAYALTKAGEAAAAGIKIFTIGLDNDINATMLQQIASATGGQYYFAPTAGQLQAIFDQIAFDTCEK